MPTPKKKVPTDQTLSTLSKEPETLQTSVGEIQVSRFKLKHISQINIYIAEMVKAINLDTSKGLDTANLQEIFKGINIRYLLYVMAENDSQCLMLLLSCSTGKALEELGELEDEEAMILTKLVFQVAVLPMLESMGNVMGVDLTRANPRPTGQT